VPVVAVVFAAGGLSRARLHRPAAAVMVVLGVDAVVAHVLGVDSVDVLVVMVMAVMTVGDAERRNSGYDRSRWDGGDRSQTEG